MATPLTPVITEHWDRPDLSMLDGYRAVGGYRALAKALKSVVVLGYLTADDFAHVGSDWLDATLKEIEFAEPSPCSQA